MISPIKLIKIFENSEDVFFPKEELLKFLKSTRKMFILYFAGDVALKELLRHEETRQWPILCKLGNEKLDIYQEAEDISSLNMFISSIKDEMTIRSQKDKLSSADYAQSLYLLTESRISLFVNMFEFNKNDLDYCEKAAKRYVKMKRKALKKRKILKRIGYGFAAAGGIVVLGKVGKTMIKKYKKHQILKKKG